MVPVVSRWLRWPAHPRARPAPHALEAQSRPMSSSASTPTLRLAHTPDGAAAILLGWEQGPRCSVRLSAVSLYYSDRAKTVAMHRHGVGLEIAKHMAADGSVRDGLIVAGHKLILAAAGRDNPQRDSTASLAALLEPLPEAAVQRELFALAVRARPLFDAVRCCLGAGAISVCADSAAWWAEEVAAAP